MFGIWYSFDRFAKNDLFRIWDSDTTFVDDFVSRARIVCPPKKVGESDSVGYSGNYLAVTFTTESEEITDLELDLKKFLSSKISKVVSYVIGRELTKEGRPHYHLCVKTSQKVYVSNLHKIKWLGRAEIRTLKTSLDVKRWMSYCTKGQRDKVQRDIDYFAERNLELVEDISI